MSRLRVDFPCRVIFTCLYTHVNFTRVNKIEASYEVSRLNVKLTNVPLLCLRGKTFHSFTLPQERIKGLYPLLIASILFANINFTHVRSQKLRGSGNPPGFKSDKLYRLHFLPIYKLQITDGPSLEKYEQYTWSQGHLKFYTIPTSMINTVKPPSATNSRKRPPPLATTHSTH